MLILSCTGNLNLLLLLSKWPTLILQFTNRLMANCDHFGFKVGDNSKVIDDEGVLTFVARMHP